jgi:hypothetical protein
MNIIKKLLLSTFGDGFFGLERDQNTQEEITNGYREYQKEDKELEPISVCYASLPKGWNVQSDSCTSMGTCASPLSQSFTTGQYNVAIGHGGLETGLGLYTHFEERVLE